MSLRILLVDDHDLFRQGLRVAIEPHRDLSVVGEAADARGAVTAAEAYRPDVVVLDLTLPGADGLAVAGDVLRAALRPRILVLSMHSSDAYVRAALATGVSGYALKSQPAPAVIEAIRAVGRGEMYLAPTLSPHLLKARGERALGESRSVSAAEILSRREYEIFRLIIRGLSNTAIAAELCISVKTVETHRAKINRKMGAHSPAELVRLAALGGDVVE
jgi:DNA-binding NarL/FixJ family response regulator